MKNLKYIYALSSIFVSFYVFGYNTNFSNETSSSDTSNKETESNQKELNKFDKKEVIDAFNNYYSSSRSFKLSSGSLISKASSSPVTLNFKGNYEFNSNSLEGYTINTDYTYNSKSKNYDVSFGSTSYNTINYNNKVYLFSNDKELKGILSFPSTLDTSFPVINEDSTFSSIFDNILNLNESNVDVSLNDNGYLFESNKFKFSTDNDFNLIKVESLNNDNLIYTFNFENIKSNTSSVTKLDINSRDILTTLKSLLKNSSFNIGIDAEIKSSDTNIKFNGDVVFDYSSSIIKTDPLITLDLKEYYNNNFANSIKVYYENNDIYFNLDNLLKGKIKDSTISDIIEITSGLFTDQSLNYDLNNSLNTLINTETFSNIFNLDFSSLDTSIIKDLELKNNVITFKLDSKAFNLDSGLIKFEIGLNNAKVKTIKIKDFKYNEQTINLSLRFNNPITINELINKDKYPSYDSLIPYYKNILKLSKETSIGGAFETSLFDSNTSYSLGLSSNFNINYKDVLSSSDINNINVSLDDLNINFLDESDLNKESNIFTSMLLEDTSSSNKNSFNISLDELNYKNNTFYFELSDSKSSNKYILENDSISTLIDSVNKLNSENKEESGSSTDKGIKNIKNEIKRIDHLIYIIQNNKDLKELIEYIKNNYSLNNVNKYISITPVGSDFKIEFNLYSLLGYDESIMDDYSLNNSVSILLSSNGEILNIKLNDLSMDGMTSSISLTLKDYDTSKELTDEKIKEEWENEEGKPSKSKNLKEIINRTSDLIDIYKKYNLESSSLSNLINVDFAYKDLEISGDVSSILHFNSEKKLDEKYFEAYIPLKLNDKKGANDISQVNLSLVYSDKNKEESNFGNLVYNYLRLYEGTQAAISFNYGSNIYSRNYSTLYAYSSTNSIMNIVESLSNISENNILYSYKIVQSIKEYAGKIIDAINNKDSIDLNKYLNLGLINNENIIKILNAINATSNTLDIDLDLSKVTSNEILSKFNIKVSLTLDIDTDSNGNKTVSLKSIKAQDENQGLSLNINIEETLVNKDSTYSIYKKKLSRDIIKGFISVQSDYVSSNATYVDMEYLANLISLGIYTTSKKYYSFSGTLNIDDTLNINIDTLGIDADLSDIKPINSVTFNLRLNFYKQNEDYSYKIKSYLSLKNDKHPTYTTEFFIEEAEDGNDTIYINETNGYSNSMSFMKKETMLGNVKVSVTETNDEGNEEEVKTGELPRILYYLLDVSGILNDEIIEVNYSVIELKLALKELILSSLFDMMIQDDTEDANKNDIQIDYLNGWNLYVEKDSKTNLINGYLEADLSKLILGISLGDLATFKFGSKVKLTFKQLSDDIILFNLNQSNTNASLIYINLNYGDIELNLKVQLKESSFYLISTNSTYQINTGMERYNDLVKYFKTLDLYKNNQELYVTKIICPEIVVEYTFPINFDIYSKYRVNFNNISYKHYCFDF